MFLLNLPLCILFAVVYMNILEDGLIQLLPSFLAKKWPRFGRNVKTYAIAEWLNFVFWTMVGMLTHLGWDGFTHSSGVFVSYLPVLRTQVDIGTIQVPVFKLIQHVSTGVGLLVMFIYLLLRPKRMRMPQDCCKKLHLRLVFFGIIITIALIRRLIFGAPASLQNYGEWIVSLMTYSFISWSILSVIIKRNEHQAIQEFLTS